MPRPYVKKRVEKYTDEDLRRAVDAVNSKGKSVKSMTKKYKVKGLVGNFVLLSH